MKLDKRLLAIMNNPSRDAAVRRLFHIHFPCELFLLFVQSHVARPQPPGEAGLVPYAAFLDTVARIL